MRTPAVIKCDVSTEESLPHVGRPIFERPRAMLITKVELDNIKNYDYGCFEFEAGVTAICGPNGSGKTTILEAISWVLFDHIPYKKEDFLRRGAKKGSARVSFV